MNPAVGGVDGARGQWLMAAVTGAGVQLHLFPRFEQVMAAADAQGLRCVGVDMPIGLPATGPRPADMEARRRLGR